VFIDGRTAAMLGPDLVCQPVAADNRVFEILELND